MRTHLVAALSVVLGLPCGQVVAADVTAKSPTSESENSEWKPLFNGRNLEGWDTVLRETGRNDDPTGVVQVDDGMIHMYKNHTAGKAVPLGYIATKSDYSHYHLRLEYRWGEKKFAPRTKSVRDAGLLYHAANDAVVWPLCVECQIQEGDTGDCFVVRGAQLDTTVAPTTGDKSPLRFLDAKNKGIFKTVGSMSVGRVVKSDTHERDGWNRVEVIVRGADEVEHIVNGHTVFKGTNLRTMETDAKPSVPLAHGRILLQAEFAEVFYRNIEIRPVTSGPLQPPKR